ncbi:MAG: DUF1501 domain-containing protein [Bacteroidota bacterium]
MKRREFLQYGSAAWALPLALGGFRVEALARNHVLNSILDDCEGRILVLVQLNGGNDGLNTVIPLDQYSQLTAARPGVVLPSSSVLPLGNGASTGLHPSLAGLHSLHQDQKLGLVQSVGYPDPNFSHFRATDIWTSGSPSDEVWTDGWLGRYLDHVFPNYPTGYPNGDMPDPLAITIGSVVSQTCQGPVANMSMAIPNLNSFLDLSGGAGSTPPNTRYGHELGYLRDLMSQTNQYFNVLEAAAQAGQNVATYPGSNRLANQLQIVAKLISGGLQTPIYVVNQGGFDTHADQVDRSNPTIGDHANLLDTVGSAIHAFQEDLRQMGLEDRVLGMTFSEFGRRIKANGSYGTDHGAAAPLFLFGSQVNPSILGSNPSIPANATPGDNIPMQYDFRSVYGSILQDWFCVPELTIKSLLFEDYQYLPLVQGSTAIEEAQGLEILDNYPNPFDQHTYLRFYLPEPGWASVQIYDGQGRRLETVAERNFPGGEVKLVYHGSHLSNGVYYLRVQAETQRGIRAMLKQ